MLYLILATIAAFLATYVLTPEAVKFLHASGIVGKDQQKPGAPVLPTSGGITVLFGFLAGISMYLGLVTFAPTTPLVEADHLLAALSSIFIIGIIGLIDDIHVDQNGRKEKGNEQVRVGLAQKYKYFAPLIAALPLMVVEAGVSTMTLPVVGIVETGVLYALVLIPIGVTSVVNATNMLAGQNGLETSMGLIALTGLGVFTALNGQLESAAVSFSMAAALAAFLVYNWYPAHILPGDSLTYAVGAAFVAAVIIGNAERFGVVVFLPWIVEAFLKLRSRFQASSLGVLQDDGTLKPQHDKIYSLTHVFMRFNVTEPRLVRYAATMELVLVVLALAWLL